MNGNSFDKAFSRSTPHFQEGPDLSNPLSDGGLLVLSKHAILQHHQLVYSNCAGADCLANKGVIHIRVQPPSALTPYDIFYSHTQNIEESGGQAALYSQLTQMYQLIAQTADPDHPTIVLGDLIIPAEMSNHYAQLLSRLHDPVDLWAAAGHAVAIGFTLTATNNFYQNDEDNPQQNQRLDYILMRAGRKVIPIVASMGILAFTRNGRFISDHFGLRAVFGECAQVSA